MNYLYTYYDANGNLLETINDTSLRAGNIDINGLAVCLDGYSNTGSATAPTTISSVDYSATLPDGTETTTQTISTDFPASGQVPYDKNRLLTHFAYNTPYWFIYIPLTAFLGHGSGLLSISVALNYANGTRLVLGKVNVMIDGTVIKPTSDITLGNYNYLLSVVNGYVTVAELSAETLARTTADTTLGTRIDTEASTRASADTALQTSINNLAVGNVTFDNSATALTTLSVTDKAGTTTKYKTVGCGNASGVGSVSAGNNSTASGINSTAIGIGATASGNYSVASGSNSTASGNEAVANGRFAISSNSASVAIGAYAEAGGASAIAIGANPTAGGVGSISIGANTEVQYDGSIAIGQNADATVRAYEVAIGNGAISHEIYSTAIGDEAEVYVPSWVSFDGISDTLVRTLSLKSTDNIFFRNENVSHNKSTQASYTSGQTLTQVLATKVGTTGDQSIAGNKTFSNDIKITDTYGSYAKFGSGLFHYHPAILGVEYTIFYPQGTGTLALTSDIPTYYSHGISIIDNTNQITLLFNIITKSSTALTIADIITKLTPFTSSSVCYTASGSGSAGQVVVGLYVSSGSLVASLVDSTVVLGSSYTLTDTVIGIS